MSCLHTSVITGLFIYFIYFILDCLFLACFVEETLSVYATVKAGAERVAGITKERYLDRLSWLKQVLRFTSVYRRDPHIKTPFARVSTALETLKLENAQGTVRKQPYCVVLWGEPGCGKTGTAITLAAACMRLKYGKFLPSDIVTLNETDEFQSEFRTNHKVVIFDDVAAMSDFRLLVEKDPWRKVIDFVNNIRKTALNPNVELKGNVYIEPDLVIITTNRAPYFKLSQWCYCSMAIIRRISKNIHLLNDRKYCTFVDLNKEFLGLRQKLLNDSPDISDVSGVEYRQYLSQYTSRHIRDYPNDKFENEESLVKITKEEMFKTVAAEFMAHLEDQTIFVDRINSNFDKVVERTFFSALYNDLVKPFLPIMPKMDDQMLYKMSYWYRLKYFISVKDIVPIAQMGCDDIDVSSDESEQHDVIPNPEPHWSGFTDPESIEAFDIEASRFYSRFPVEQYKKFLEVCKVRKSDFFVVIDGKLYISHYDGLWYDVCGRFHKMDVHENFTFGSSVAEHLYKEKSLDYSESSQVESLNQELEGLNINTPEIPIPIGLEIRKDEYSSLAPLVLCGSWRWCTKTGNEVLMPRGLPFKKAVISKVRLFAHWIDHDYLSSYPNALTFFIYLLFDNNFMKMDYIRVEERHVLCVGTCDGNSFMLGLNATDEDQYLPNVDPLIPFFRITLDGLKVYSNKPIPFILDGFLSNYKEACEHLRFLLGESIPKYDRKILCQKY